MSDEITLERLLAHGDHVLTLQIIYYDQTAVEIEDLVETIGGWHKFNKEMQSLWDHFGAINTPGNGQLAKIKRGTQIHPCYWASAQDITIHDLLEDALALGFVDQVMRVSGVLRRHGYDHHTQVRRPARKRR